jgi:hypothetical protein
MTHAEARQVILQAFQQALARAPTGWEAQVVQAVCWGETSYGEGWKKGVERGTTEPEAVISRNWGAVQYGPPPATPGKSFVTTDTHRDGTKYQFAYKMYPDNVAGAADVVSILERNGALGIARKASATAWDIARKMIGSGYAEGSGWQSGGGAASEAEATRKYAQAFIRWRAAVATGVGESAMPAGSEGHRWAWIGLAAMAVGGVWIWRKRGHHG